MREYTASDSIGVEGHTLTTGEGVAYVASYLVLKAALVIAIWLCFRRTGIRSFLFLGAVLILWPWFDIGMDALSRHFLEQVMRGERPWLFPFSLMVREGNFWSGWRMLPAEFLTKFMAAKGLLEILLLATAFGLIARAAKSVSEDRSEGPEHRRDSQ